MTRAIDDEPSPAFPVLSTPAVALLKRPLEALWPLHEASSPLPGQAHVSVPLAGGPPHIDAATHINRYLEQMWVHNPVATSIRVTSVAVTIIADPAPDAPAPRRLILMITYESAPGDQALDSLHMARHVQAALDHAA